jgi:hypothetical protein
MKFIPTKAFSLKASKEHDEKWLQGLLAEEESILGLGPIEHLKSEVIQNNGGRLDLMFQDESGDVRYCVELQLGATDPSHIIRTLEYWDNERSRNPHIEHIAVIVAEDITTRFLNVISLFNKAVPLIAIQLNAFEINGDVGINCVKVLDLAQNMGWEDDNTSAKAVTDRPYWEKRATPSTLQFTDELFRFVKEVVAESTLELKNNKHYIGLASGGVANNFISMKPRKHNLLLQVKLSRTDEITELIEQSLELISYDAKWRQYQIRVTSNDLAENQDLLRDLIGRAAGVKDSSDQDS